MEGSSSKISNVEWALVIAALFTIDLIQIVLEWLVIGVFINWIIDIFVGMGFAFYLQVRGQSLANPKRLGALAATFVAEMIPIIDELPLWGMDGIFNMVLSKSDKIMSRINGKNNINEDYEMGLEKNTSRTGSLTEQIDNSTNQIRAVNQALTDEEE